MLSAGVVKSNIMAKMCGCKSPFNMLPYLKPRGVTRSKIYVKIIYFLSKSHKHTKGIFHNGVTKNHTVVLNTESHQSIIDMVGWDIIKRCYSWIDYQGVNMGGPSNVWRRLQLVYTSDVVINGLDRECYLVIVSQDLFN